MHHDDTKPLPLLEMAVLTISTFEGLSLKQKFFSSWLLPALTGKAGVLATSGTSTGDSFVHRSCDVIYRREFTFNDGNKKHPRCIVHNRDRETARRGNVRHAIEILMKPV